MTAKHRRTSIQDHQTAMGVYYIITKKGIKRASADVGLMFIAYNLRRLMNIIDPTAFKKFLQELVFNFFLITTSIKSCSILFSLQNLISFPTNPLGTRISFSVSSTNLKYPSVPKVFLPIFFLMMNSELAKFNPSFK